MTEPLTIRDHRDHAAEDCPDIHQPKRNILAADAVELAVASNPETDQRMMRLDVGRNRVWLTAKQARQIIREMQPLETYMPADKP